ncbi:hypothetical protein [Nocardia salmonicida]|uniref:hypothetical protein n=1 Tax=Nocardia salmonicida TaxID=53431 RepID=UPI003626E104
MRSPAVAAATFVVVCRVAGGGVGWWTCGAGTGREFHMNAVMAALVFLPKFLCHNPVRPWSQLWPQLRTLG